MAIPTKTVNELKAKETAQELQKKIEEDKQRRAQEFAKYIKEGSEKYNCKLLCRREEIGLENEVSVSYSVLIQAQ